MKSARQEEVYCPECGIEHEVVEELSNGSVVREAHPFFVCLQNQRDNAKAEIEVLRRTINDISPPHAEDAPEAELSDVQRLTKRIEEANRRAEHMSKAMGDVFQDIDWMQRVLQEAVNNKIPANIPSIQARLSATGQTLARAMDETSRKGRVPDGNREERGL